jgi:hypothetical protein
MNRRVLPGLATVAMTVLLSLSSLGLNVLPAHAQSMNTITITDCSNDIQLSTAEDNATSGDTINFSCSGTITLSRPLSIDKNLTLDGSGQKVILSGGNSRRVLQIANGVQFTLNQITITGGFVPVPYVGSSGGGGLYNLGGTVTITNSTFSNNWGASVVGGGLYTKGGTVAITNSTFSNNTASGLGGSGGGLFNSGGTVTITNSTFSDNRTSNSGGGTTTITNSTFSNNTAAGSSGGGLSNFRGSGSLKVSASIVANNTGGNCGGKIADMGYNLGSGTDCGFTAPTDQQNTDPKFDGALKDNGGPTQTIALQQDSPAVNKIPADATFTDANNNTTPMCPATDQRGYWSGTSHGASCLSKP